MASTNLKYGRSAISLEYDPSRFEVIGSPVRRPALTDVEIGASFDHPIGSPLEEIVAPGETVLIAVPDATRQTASGQIVNLLVRRLIANGTAPHEIRIIFATGIHRHVTEAEKQTILTPFIAQRIGTAAHDAHNQLKLFKVGETSGGIPIELNWMLTEYDHVVLVGGVTFHYFAGFTGGRKLICPGLASARTLEETHKLAFDFETKGRRSGVGPGLLEGNAVHEAFVEAVETIKPAFAINTIVDNEGSATDVFCGDWKESHRAACEQYADGHTIRIAEKRELVIVSCGGYPFDINMIQAHKALDAASRACSDGGTIVLLAECSDGPGRDDFPAWFAARDSADLAERLCSGYQVNGQTAWSVLEKAERFNVHLLSSLPADDARRMRLLPIEDGADIQRLTERTGGGYILPFGSKFLPVT